MDGNRAAVIIYCKLHPGLSKPGPALSQRQREGSGSLRCGHWSCTHSSAGAVQSPQFRTLPSSNPSPNSRNINKNLLWFLNSHNSQLWMVNTSFPSFSGEEKENRPLFGLFYQKQVPCGLGLHLTYEYSKSQHNNIWIYFFLIVILTMTVNTYRELRC